MNSAGVTPQSLQQKWQFGVEIDGFDAAFFTQSDFPEFESEETEFNPAGSMFPQKAAGRISFSDVTMEKGIPQETTERGILAWIESCVDFLAAEGTGSFPSEYMKDVDLIKYDRAGEEIQRFRLHDAWVKTAKFGEGDGSSSDNEIETMTITYQYFTEE